MTPEQRQRLAELCGAKLTSWGWEGEYVFPDGRKMYRKDWAPGSNRNHLAVVLQDVERQGGETMWWLIEKISRHFLATPGRGFHHNVDIIHLFANSPATIAEVCLEVLEEAEKKGQS